MTYLQMSRAFLASPDTADTLRAQNCTADASMTLSADACEETKYKHVLNKKKMVWFHSSFTTIVCEYNDRF